MFYKHELLKIFQISQEKICAEVSSLIKLHTGDLQLYSQKRHHHRCFPVTFVKSLRASSLEVSCRCSHRRCSIKKVFLKFFHKYHRKTPVLESLYNQVASLGLGPSLQFDYKEAATKVFSCKICEIFQMTQILKICERLLLTLPKESFRIFPQLNSC